MNYIPVSAVWILVGIIVGVFIFFRPAVVIRLQIKFYEKINWRIEPISLPKELKNTRYMGLFLVLFCLLASFYIRFFLSV
jgi:hypothetical protein